MVFGFPDVISETKTSNNGLFFIENNTKIEYDTHKSMHRQYTFDNSILRIDNEKIHVARIC